MQLLDSIIKSNVNRPSEINWRSIKYSGEGDARNRWDGLVEDYARDEDLDLPLCKLAKVVKDLYGTNRAPTQKQSKKRKRGSSPTEEEEIAGHSMSTIRAAIGKIMADHSVENLTVKKIRKKLEKELEIDLLPHKTVIKNTIKDML